MCDTIYERHLEEAFNKHQQEIAIALGRPVRLEISQRREAYPTMVWDCRLKWVDPKREDYDPAGFTLTSTPPIVVSSQAWVAVAFQRRGVGTLLNRVRIEAFKAGLDSRVMICTVHSPNSPQERLLTKNGWRLIEPGVDHKSSVWGMFK